MKKFPAILMIASLAATLIVSGCGATSTASSAPSSNSASGGGASSAKLDDVKVAFDDSVAEAGIILGDKLGYFQQQGIKVDITKFQSGADELTALAADQVSVSRGIINAGLFNASAKGIDIKLVADGGTNVPGKGYFRLCIRKDLAGKVKDYKDLKGLKIGVASLGGINELLAQMALEKGGLTGKDVQFVTVDSFPDLNTALSNKTVDAIMQIDPLVTQGIKGGYLDPWKDPSDYAAGEEISVLMFSPQFAAKKDVADRFMVAYLQGVRAYNDALISGTKDQDKIINILTQNTSVKDPAVMKAMLPPGLDPNGVIPKSGVEHDQKWYMDKGLVKTAADVNKLIDTEYVDYAINKIGKYQPAK